MGTMTKPHIIISFIAVVSLMIFHYLSPWIASKLPDNGKKFVSFAGGISVAYVFLDMLPDLVEYNKPVGEYLLEHRWLTALTELWLYIVSLTGFIIYYGLEILAERHRKHEYSIQVYTLHLTTFCIYNFIITYTMALKAMVSTTAVALFTMAMAFHFVFTDRKFERYYPHKFNHFGRFILILSLFSGWVCSVIFDPVNILKTAFLTAFLAGSMLLNTFREELPAANMINFIAFTLGAVLIAAILLIHTLQTRSITSLISTG